MYPRIPILLLFFLVCTRPLPAQESASARTTVSKNRVMLGEPFEWEITLRLPRKPALSYSLPDSVPPFEKRGDTKIDSQDVGDFRLIRARYTLATFDSGHWLLPPVTVGTSIRSDTLGVDVYFTFTDTTRSFHDLKEIVSVPPGTSSRRWWLMAGVAFLLLAGLLFILLRKRSTKPAPQTRTAPATDPFAEARQELAKLRAAGLDNKSFYTRLIDIFRWYIFRRKGLLSLQQTTDDLVRQLSAHPPAGPLLEQVARVLQQGDMAKFARYESSAPERDQALDTVERYIHEMEKSNRPSGADTP